MKTNRRVHTNAKPQNSEPQGKPAPINQAAAEQRSATNKNDRPFDESFDYPSCLCIYDRVGRAIVSKVIAEDEFYTLQGACLLGDMESLIAEAVREKIKRLGRSEHRVGDTQHSAICLSTVVSKEEDALVRTALRARKEQTGEPQELPEFIKAAVIGAAQKTLARDPQGRGAGDERPACAEMLAVADSLRTQCAKTRYLMESLLAIARDVVAGEDLHSVKDALEGFGFILDEQMGAMNCTLKTFDRLRSMNTQASHPASVSPN